MKSEIAKLCFGCLSILAILVFTNGCSPATPTGPFSTTEISVELGRVRTTIPVYVPKPGSPYSNIIPIFYYYNDSSENQLQTFFMQDIRGKLIRIAKLRTASIPPALDDAIVENQKATIEWADARSTKVCRFTPMTVYRDSMPGDPYQTCLVWWSDNYTFLFYSTLPLDETLTLINALERIR
jgi:hypothetical protein